MHPLLFKIYHTLPPITRSFAASLRGYYLRSWRYGPETEQLVEDALERDTWSAEKWKNYQEDRLGYILNRAATKVPYYGEQWTKRRQHGDNAGWEYLENWKVLEKAPLRENPGGFVADDCDIRQMFQEHTSGTSGTPLHLWWSRTMVRQWYALFEARWRRWYGVSKQHRWAILGGQLVTPANQKKPPFWVYNAALNQLYLSSYHLAPEFIPHYIDALTRFRPEYIYAYTSSIHSLAQVMVRQNLRVPVKVVITNAEPLYDYQRELIAQAFQCPVRETYGMSEGVIGASECQAGNLHLWKDAGVVEILQQDRIVDSGSGELICTGLLNEVMPLIRYRVGDSGSLSDSSVTCSCGRTLPILTSIEGRTDDLLITRDGRQIGRLDPIFKASFPIKEAQIIQEHLDQVRVNLVPDVDYTQDVGQLIVEQIQSRMGSIKVLIELVNHIPRRANGKFKAVICNLPPEERNIAGSRSNA